MEGHTAWGRLPEGRAGVKEYVTQTECISAKLGLPSCQHTQEYTVLGHACGSNKSEVQTAMHTVKHAVSPQPAVGYLLV